MALVKCKECGGQVSTAAAACPQCGAKIKRFKWWLWGPVAAVIAFLAYGASIPQYKADAQAARRFCEQSFARGAVASLRECDILYDNMMAKGRKP